MTTFPFSLEINKTDKITSITLTPTPSACNSDLEKTVIGAWQDKTQNIRDIVKLDHLPPFQLKVLQHLRTLKPTETTTYGKIAKAIGHPRAARAVGSALAKNPYPLIFPCHKVTRADGSLGNFSCKAPSIEIAVQLKQALIDFEGDTNENRA